MAPDTSRRAFTRSDFLALLVTLSVAAALALAATRQMRQEAMTASSLSQLRWLAGATSSYAADSNDQFWSYSWKAGPLPHSDPTLPATASSDREAASVQAVDILRRRAGRPDMPVLTGWIPHVSFNHLPLIDYFAGALPDFNLVSPGDQHRLNWAQDPAAFDHGAFLPFQPAPGDTSKRWPYSSSYQASIGFWDRADTPIDRILQASSHDQYLVPGAAMLGGAALTHVAFPSQKVMVYDAEQRELGASGRYFADRDARVTLLMADSSAGVRATGRANEGWLPHSPSSVVPTRFWYQPSPWEAQLGAGRVMIGHYRWTRGGIEGIDFAGAELDTGQY